MSKYEYKENGTVYDTSSILVLKDKTPREVAEAMIRSGCQREPFFILDFDAAYNSVKKFRTKMPRIQLFYAMKSNDDSMMVKLAIALGLGFDCASPGEINKIRKLNVSPTSIIYAMSIKTAEQMKFARDSGVRHTTFDSPCELMRLNQFWPDARLLVRVKLESNSVYKLGNKFGCEFDEAVTLLDEAARLGITVIGVAFHVGSGCFSKESYSTGLSVARALFDHEAKNGRKMTILDIGGGFFNDDTDIFDQVADVINKGLDEWFPESDVQVIAEPGRFICEPAFTLYTNINDIRTNNSNKKQSMVYVNSGLYNSMASVETWHTMDIIKISKNKKGNEKKDGLIWGPSPDDHDFLGPSKMSECTPLDWLAFNQHGAYCYVFNRTYCRQGRFSVRSVISTELWNLLKDDPVFSLYEFVTKYITPNLPSNLPPILKSVDKFVRSYNNNATIIE